VWGLEIIPHRYCTFGKPYFFLKVKDFFGASWSLYDANMLCKILRGNLTTTFPIFII
jgi:hypothetical protein